jgi:hypothetical protein
MVEIVGGKTMISIKAAQPVAVACGLIASLIFSCGTAQAQFGFRLPVPIVPGGIVIGPGQNQYYGQRRHRDHEENSSEQSKDSVPRVTVSQETASTVFKSIVVSKSLGAVGVEEPIDTEKRDWARDSERDYVGAIQGFLATIDAADKAKSSRGDSSLAQGDVTQHAIDLAVTQAYERKKFATFEQFVGEQWTNERLRVAILDHARAKLPGLLVGNNRGRVTMEQIKEIIDQAADAIYDQTLETSELVALNQATARFTRSLYESRGPAIADSLGNGVEDVLLSASAAALTDYQERFIRAGELGVILHYRAERITIDCLTANAKTITTGRDAQMTRDQMNQKVATLVKSGAVCNRWVVSGIGDPKQSDADGDKRTFKPFPVRAVWTEVGEPKTDASMFRRVN